MAMQMQACDRCHRRKTKCDRRVPRCGSCDKANTPCVHTDKLNLLPYPRAYIHSLESTIKHLETENKKLTNELKALRSSVVIPSPESTPSSSADDNGSHCHSWPSSNGNNERYLNTTENVVSSEVGYLTLKSTGEQRYLGSGSGVPLASIVYSLVGSGSLPYLQGNECQRDQDPQVTRTSLLTLPSREDAIPAIEAYFYHWHLTFPLLSRPQFLGIVDQIYSDTEFYSTNPFEAFLFDMVLGMGCTNFNRLDWPSASSETHYMRGISKLPKVLSMNGLAPLQAILFLCQYSIFCSLRDTSANMWHLVGIAVRLCVEMGLHRRSKLEESAAQGLEGGKIYLELEIRKRTFWCLYNLDRIISITLGRPVALRDEDIDVSLPTAFDIDDLPMEELTRGTYTEKLRHTSPFLHLISVRRLAGKILQDVHCTTENKSLSPEEKHDIQRSFHRDLEAWRAGISDINVFSHKDEQPTSSFRPSPTFPHTGSLSEAVVEDPLITLNNILSSSISVIYLYAELHRTRRLNYSWITLHAVFMAGLSHVYSISRIIKETKRRRASLPPSLEYTQIIDVTRTCSNVLVAINERWATARGSCEIFDYLSNAIIQDAVKAQLNFHKSGASLSGDNGKHPMTPVCTPRPCPGNKDFQSPLQPGQPHHEQDSVMTGFPHNYSKVASSISDDQFICSSISEPLQSSMAENGFRQFYNNLQGEVLENLRDPGMVPSEVVMGFSQDWFAGDSMSVQHSSSTDMMDLWEIMGLVPSANQFQ